MTTERLYRTGTTLERTLRVAYPAGRGRVVLRTERDWERDIEPDVVSDDGNTSTFTVRADQPFLYFKACLVGDQGRHWSVGPNKLLLMAEDDQRSVWGSSLGGVVSFYSVWQHPDVFGVAVCMSSTFSHRDDLIERVLREPERDVAFYLDSGWPGDNYEVTMAMAMALVSRGWRYGVNLLHLSFPRAEHDETAWGLRLHLPMQFLNGAVARACRAGMPILGDQPYRS